MKYNAILRIKLTTLDSDNKRRRNLAKYYSENLKNLPIFLPKEKKEINMSITYMLSDC